MVDETRSVEQIQESKASIEALLGEIKAFRERIADLEGSVGNQIQELLAAVSNLQIKVLEAINKELDNKAIAVAKRTNE
jgi:hypothetical protein